MEGQIKEYKSRCEFSDKEIARLTASTSQLQSYIDVLENRATDAEVQAEEAATSIADLQRENKNVKDANAKLNAKVEDLQEKLELKELQHKKDIEEAKRKLKEEMAVYVFLFIYLIVCVSLCVLL